MDSSPYSQPWSLNCRGKLLTFSQPAVMGILNLTPDSFYAESRVAEVETAVQRAQHMLDAGADLLDLGAQSTRPGAEIVGAKVEWERLKPRLIAVREAFPEAILSVDTFQAEVAKKALEAGADLINDVSAAAQDPELADVVAEFGCPYIFMHMRGTPKTMQSQTEYANVVRDVFLHLDEKKLEFRERGIQDLIADPGFGFGKTVAQNWALMRGLPVLQQLGIPLLVGVSRKSMLCKLLHITPQQSLPATTASHLFALMNGAQLIRVHDVAEATQARTIAQQLQPA